MATLAADSPMAHVLGEHNSVPILAYDIVYESAMVGDNGSGYGRPLVAGDKFLGHAIEKVDNTGGSAGDKNIRLLSGRYRLVVALVGLITDVGQPVYASDDAVLTFSAAGNSYVGVISRYESATKMEVEFRVGEYDEFGNNVNRVLKSASYTTLITDCGKIIYVDTDAVVITLCIGTTVLGGSKITIVNAAGFGVSGLIIDPDDADLIAGGCGLAAGADGKKFTNTKATAERGDFLELTFNSTTGWNVTNARGTWAIET